MIRFMTLREVCTHIIDCPHESPKWLREGIPVIRNFNLVDGHIDLSDIYYVDEETYKKRIKRVIPKEGDIIFSREAPIGNCAIIPAGFKCCLGQRLVLLRANKEICSQEYLLTALLSDYVKKQIEQVSKRGSIVSNFNIGDLGELVIPIIENQRGIVSIAEALRQKISNNKKITEELESMAKTLYDYWFLQFEFPNEEGKPYKSSGGKMVWNEEVKREIPEGWEVVCLGEKCNCILGGTPSRENETYWNGNINWINSGKINEFRITTASEKITYEGMNNSSTSLLPRNTVVLAITGATLGQVSILNIDSCANQSVVGILENNNIPTEYIYPFIITSLKQLLNQQTGAAQPHINKNDIKSIPLVVPPEVVMDEYIDKVKNMYDLIMNNEQENQELASLRDFLLPLLMNGQVGFKEEE